MTWAGLSSKQEKRIAARMELLHIHEEDIEESFVRSSAPGGQHVNKVSTCVKLVHRPTGISVKCQQERSQAVNRLLARDWLLTAIERQRLDRLRAEKKKLLKLRRQNRRRSHSEKKRILEHKRRHSQKKGFRKKLTAKMGDL